MAEPGETLQRKRGVPRVVVEGLEASKLFRQVAATLSNAALSEAFDNNRSNTVTIDINTQDPEAKARMNLDVFNRKTKRGAFFALSADAKGYSHAGNYWPRFDMFAELTEVGHLSDKVLDDEWVTSTLGEALPTSDLPYSLVVRGQAGEPGLTTESFPMERRPVNLDVVLDLARRAADTVVALG